ncbi:MAG: hypothetical protein AAF405_02760 [Pseudomonadota bacterium]
MAQHNPLSRAYFVIVMVAIVICFVIAQIILSGGHGKHAEAGHDHGHKAESAAPAAAHAEETDPLKAE